MFSRRQVFALAGASDRGDRPAERPRIRIGLKQEHHCQERAAGKRKESPRDLKQVGMKEPTKNSKHQRKPWWSKGGPMEKNKRRDTVLVGIRLPCALGLARFGSAGAGAGMQEEPRVKRPENLLVDGR